MKSERHNKSNRSTLLAPRRSVDRPHSLLNPHRSALISVPSRHGFTFIELLIVITIIGILVALLLPAVQAAREAARRGSCQKRLEQTIIAVHNYETLHRVYPPGTIDATGPIQSLPQGYHHNWIVQLLPYLELKAAYAHTDHSVGVYDAKNAPVRQLKLPVLLCPSQSHDGKGYSDFAAVHNDMEVPIDVDNNGAFFLNSRVRQVDVSDGMSNTLFIGEKITVSGDLGWMSGTNATLRNMGVNPNAAGIGRRARRGGGEPHSYPPGLQVADETTEELPSDEDLIALVPSLPLAFNVRNDKRRIGGPRRWNDYGTEPVEGSQRKTISVRFAPPTKGALVVGGFSSPHPGGSQFAHGDGSVRFVAETIDPQVLLDLGNRHDGEFTDGGEY